MFVFPFLTYDQDNRKNVKEINAFDQVLLMNYWSMEVEDQINAKKKVQKPFVHSQKLEDENLIKDDNQAPHRNQCCSTQS